MSTYPIRVTFGAVNNSHALLRTDIDRSKIPGVLANLTDRPPGHLNPTEVWAPSIGCGPIENWWGIWWTTPDENAERSGMVRSEVALWPLEYIGNVEDITANISELGNTENLQPIPIHFLNEIAETFLNHQTTSVVICNELEQWATIISKIWKQLWPQARQNFSARIALNPPQFNEPSSKLTLLGTPLSREHQWHSPFEKVKLNSENTAKTQPSRAAKYLISGGDSTIEDVIIKIPPQSSDLKHLKQISRISDSLDSLKNKADFDISSALIRTLIAISPEIHNSSDLKEYACAKLCEALETATCSQLSSLGNIEISKLPNIDNLTISFTKKLESALFQEASDQVTQLIEKLKPEMALKWWQTCLSNALTNSLGNRSLERTRSVITWLCDTKVSLLIDSFIPQSFENYIVDEIQVSQFSQNTLKKLQQASITKGWSTLHASCAIKTTDLTKAINSQLQFSGEVLPGLKFIVDSSDLSSLIDETVKRGREDLINLTAKRTTQEPEMLQYLDFNKGPSYLLWVSHIEYGGIHLPKTINEKKLTTVLDYIALGLPSYGIVKYLFNELAEIGLYYSNRKILWRNLERQEKSKLLTSVTDILIEKISNGEKFPKPESEILSELYNNTRHKPIHVFLIKYLIEWDVHFSEADITYWMGSFSASDWKIASVDIGSVARLRGWSSIAYKLFSLRRTTPEVMPALAECKSLLIWWDQYILSFEQPSLSTAAPINLNDLINRLADLGAELYPDSLSAVWERAGGSAKDLSLTGSASHQWFLATKQAHHGALPGGLLSIVKELRRQYPNNQKLIEFKQVLELLNQ